MSGTKRNRNGQKSVEEMVREEFPHLTGKIVSRQRLYQLRRERDGICVSCKLPATEGRYCTAHAHVARVVNRESMRKTKKCLARRINTRSYRDAATIAAQGLQAAG